MPNTTPNLIETAPGASDLRLTDDATQLLEVIRNWHDEAHRSPWRMCFEQPCHAARRFTIPFAQL